MNHHVSIDEVAKVANYSKKTLMDWVKKEHLLPASKLNKHRGWELSYLQKHKYLQYSFVNYKPSHKASNKVKKLDLIRKSFHKGYSVNCANHKPLIKSLIDKLIDDIDLLMHGFKKPVGFVLTLSDSSAAAKQIQKLKQRLSKRLGLTINVLYHWRKDEEGGELGKHCHVVMIFDAQKANRSLNSIRDTILDLIDIMGHSVYIDYTNKYRKKGVHIINTEQDKDSFIRHASYLAKSRTTVRGKRVFFSSHNIPKN